jgi:hypothetical protein
MRATGIPAQADSISNYRGDMTTRRQFNLDMAEIGLMPNIFAVWHIFLSKKYRYFYTKPIADYMQSVSLNNVLLRHAKIG